jgi:hypothetical protein
MIVQITYFLEDGSKHTMSIVDAKVDLTRGIREQPIREALQQWREFEHDGKISVRIAGRLP